MNLILKFLLLSLCGLILTALPLQAEEGKWIAGIKFRQDLRKSHADCWGSQLFDHVLREHAVLDLIDGFSALVGQVLES